MKRHAVIMAGGSGTRFWPASRKRRPKQMLSLWGEPMIQSTVRRLSQVIPESQQWVVTHHLLAQDMALLLPQIPRHQIIAEPVGRNTAPCIGLAAMIVEKIDGDGVLGVFPADHFIVDHALWKKTLEKGYEEAETGGMVTLGIRPTRPETGYGYIKIAQKAEPQALEAIPVERFEEKPNLTRAQSYVDSGNYFWNAGIFFFKASEMLREIQRQLPSLFKGLKSLQKAWGTEGWAQSFEEIFPKLPSISIDYGIMEGAKEIKVIPTSIPWSDVGHWGALDEVLGTDDQGNVILGNVMSLETASSVLIQMSKEQKLLVSLGIRDLVVVDTEDALMICPKNKVQEVRKIVEELQKQGRSSWL